MNRLFISESPKGGVGKTEIALLTITAMDKHGIDFEYGEIDEIRKLGIILSEKKDPKVSLRTSPSLENDLQTYDDYVEFFNPVAGLFDEPVSVLDLGGGVSEKFMEWMKASSLDEILEDYNTRPHFMSVATPDAVAFMAAISALKSNFLMFRDRADYSLILNDMTGTGFAAVKASAQISKELQNLSDNMNVNIIDVPHLPNNNLISFAKSAHLSTYEAWGLANRLLQSLKDGSDFTTDNVLGSFAAGIGLRDRPSVPEQRLYLTQQMSRVGRWIESSQNAVFQGLNLSDLCADKTDESSERE